MPISNLKNLPLRWVTHGLSLFMLFSGWLSVTGFAQGGYSYILPGMSTSNDITIGNFNPQSTTATIAFYDSSGKLNSLTAELDAGTQTRVNPTSLALTSFKGSVVVSGPLPLAVSSDQFEGTAFDYIYPSELSTKLVIPIAHGGGGATDVNVFNPGPNQAEVKVVLMQANGAHTEVRTA